MLNKICFNKKHYSCFHGCPCPMQIISQRAPTEKDDYKHSTIWIFRNENGDILEIYYRMTLLDKSRIWKKFISVSSLLYYEEIKK